MEETKKLSFTEVKAKIREHLKTALNIEEFNVTLAKQEEEVWKVNVEFKEKEGTITTALFGIDIITGEVKSFEKGRYWRF